MTDQEFLRKLRRYARGRGLVVDYRPELGKGSHAEVRLGERRTYLPRGEIKPGTLRSILRDLEIDKREF
ncbi:MAG: type II toxin-antitoxin system HicA family toxin [Acidimicrobiaceae bacterium]|nr:type II toxin-antitoxin system HicA family toxin [Acidimicrobiaceae bacterium]